MPLVISHPSAHFALYAKHCVSAPVGLVSWLRYLASYYLLPSFRLLLLFPFLLKICLVLQFFCLDYAGEPCVKISWIIHCGFFRQFLVPFVSFLESEAHKHRCKRRCLAAPCSHARERCRGGDICSLAPLLLVILVVVFSFVSKVISAQGIEPCPSIFVPTSAFAASDFCMLPLHYTLKLYLAAPPFPCSLAAFASPAGTPCAERGFAALFCFSFGVWCGWLQVAASGGVVFRAPLRR